jgi:hypothetical protein
MLRTFEYDLPSGTAVMNFTMQAPPEHGEFKRLFPDVTPDSHELVWHWEGMKLVVELRPKPIDTSVPDQTATRTAPKIVADEATYDALRGMDDANLLTAAVERGVKNQPDWTRENLIQAIAESGWKPAVTDAPKAKKAPVARKGKAVEDVEEASAE